MYTCSTHPPTHPTHPSLHSPFYVQNLDEAIDYGAAKLAQVCKDATIDCHIADTRDLNPPKYVYVLSGWVGGWVGEVVLLSYHPFLPTDPTHPPTHLPTGATMRFTPPRRATRCWPPVSGR